MRVRRRGAGGVVALVAAAAAGLVLSHDRAGSEPVNPATALRAKKPPHAAYTFCAGRSATALTTSQQNRAPRMPRRRSRDNMPRTVSSRRLHSG